MTLVTGGAPFSVERSKVNRPINAVTGTFSDPLPLQNSELNVLRTREIFEGIFTKGLHEVKNFPKPHPYPQILFLTPSQPRNILKLFL